MTSRTARGPGFRTATLETGPVRLVVFEASAGLDLGRHVHERRHFSVVLAGSMSEREGRTTRRLGPGQARSSPAGDAHDILLGPSGIRCLLVHAGSGALGDADFPPPDGRTYADGPRIWELGREQAAEIRRADDASPVAVEMLTLEVAALFGRVARGRAPGVPPWLVRVRERLADERRSPPTLAELADTAGVSRAHVARAFREHFGCTVGEHLRALRVEAARGLLLSSDLALGAVAYRAGFADQSHMTREVRDRLGVTPGRLRSGMRR